MSNVLRTQVESYSQHVRAYESDEAWRSAHEEAMACRDFEDLLDVGTRIFEALNESVRRSKASAKLLRIEDAREMEAAYRVLGSAFDAVERCVQKFGNLGYELEGAEKFQAAHTELRGILSLSVDRVARALQQLEAGQAQPFGEVVDELRRQNSAGSNQGSR